MGPFTHIITFFTWVFQSTHPVWDGTRRVTSAYNAKGISIHPSRVGWDSAQNFLTAASLLFQSTHPVWDGTTLSQLVKRCTFIFQSTHPVWDGTIRIKKGVIYDGYFNPPIPCGMGRIVVIRRVVGVVISIHPSRVGWDRQRGGGAG